MNLVEMMRSELPEYSVKIPSIDNVLTFRPFLVKEEKTLLLVSEEGNQIDILRAIKNILESCFTDIDISKIPKAEAEFLFLKLREKSVGEHINLVYRSTSTKPESIQIDLSKIEIPKRTKNKNKNIKVTESINITLRDITFNDYIKYEINLYDANSDDNIKSYACMIDSFQVNEEVLSGSDISINEKIEFIENMTEEQFSKIIEFANNAPKLKHNISTELEDGTKKEFVLNGLNDFFFLVSPT